MDNLAALLVAARDTRPTARLGLADAPMTLADALDAAASLARTLLTSGVETGRPVALVGGTTNDWLVSWIACQLAGTPVALLNPAFPDSLVADVLRPLAPQAVLSSDVRDAVPGIDARWIATAGAAEGGRPEAGAMADLPGLGRAPSDLSGYMLTSGTTGPPKLVAQSHRYFLDLGRYVADVLALTPADTVFTPLPLFHINPLGYAVLGAITAGAECVSVPKFSVSNFWAQVREAGVTVAVLHGPPLEMLKRRTTPEDAGDHRLRAAFYADPEFLSTFGIPLGVSVYGSTELGGLSHTHLWRPGDETEPAEGAAHYGGQVRLGFEHRVAADGEIQVRARVAGLLAEGYVGPGGGVRSFLEDGWIHSGDLGYEDDLGGLVYIARASDSVRVKGEFVPVPFVEEAFRHLPGIGEVAVWKRPSELVDEELVLFMVGEVVPVDQIRQVSAGLPSFMRPAAVARVSALPRDTGVGKIRRRELDLGAAVELVEL